MKKIIIFGIMLSTLFISCLNNEQKKEVSTSDSNATASSIDSSISTTTEDSLNEWEIAKIEGKTLVFNNGRSFETSLFDLKYVGYLKTKNKIPYFILSGRSCKNCDENISIYIWSPSDGAMKANGQQFRYSYPGKEEDYLTNELVYENRMFYGNCLGEESCIWVQRSLGKNKTWENSVFMVQVQNDTLREIKLSESDKLNELLSKVTKCSELPGTINTTEP
ncbi:MAG: hypothetical protein JST67_03680 [Bacteroidetes bacterium]|nr:hypothetical protein [Bacteroidota bacterium]